MLLAGWLAAALLFALVAVAVVVSWRRLSPQFWAAAAALLSLWITTGFTRGNVFLIAFRPADQPRYVYPAAFLMLLMLVELACAAKPPSWTAWIATGVLGLGLVANIDKLESTGAQNRRLAESVRAAYGATEIASKTVGPNYRPLGFFYPDAAHYLDAVRAFGSMGYSPAELQTRPAATRVGADKVLLRAEQVEPKVEPSPDPGGPPPGLATTPQGTVRSAGGCVRLRPRHGEGSFAPQPPIWPPPFTRASVPPPALAEITMPPAGVWVAAERLAEVGARIGRFADVPSVPVEMPSAGHFASLATPADGVAVPWKLMVYSPVPVSVCGLG